MYSEFENIDGENEGSVFILKDGTVIKGQILTVPSPEDDLWCLSLLSQKGRIFFHNSDVKLYICNMTSYSDIMSYGTGENLKLIR